jgi:hypothetical protein
MQQHKPKHLFAILSCRSQVPTEYATLDRNDPRSEPEYDIVYKQVSLSTCANKHTITSDRGISTTAFLFSALLQ